MASSVPVPVPVLVATENHTYKLNKDELTQLLMQKGIKDRHVCVVSVAGAFRTGKSFLLDFFIRYLNEMYVKHNVNPNWLGDENDKLLGFSWRCGPKRETVGILMWRDIYLYDDPNGDKIAIILLDTQGTFDNESTPMESVTVFGLSTMISSVMIYNIQNKCDESYLQHLHLFTEYGRMALTQSNQKPFQNLWFLIRDWTFPDDFAHGCEGGKKYLDNYLEISDKQPPELQTVRRYIKNCFTNVNCFLLPHPGKEVGRKAFDGRLKDLDEDFKQTLRDFVPSILAPENLVLKTVNEERIFVQDLLTFLDSYMSVFDSSAMPQPQTVLMATADAYYRRSIDITKKIYTDGMDGWDIGKSYYLSKNELEARHVKASDHAKKYFDQQKKMCSDDFCNKFRDILVGNIKEIYSNIKELNDKIKENVEQSMELSVNNVLEIYKEDMQKVSNGTHLEPHKLEKHHLSAKKEAAKKLKSKFKDYGSESFQEYLNDLNHKIDETYADIKNRNDFLNEQTKEIKTLKNDNQINLETIREQNKAAKDAEKAAKSLSDNIIRKQENQIEQYRESEEGNVVLAIPGVVKVSVPLVKTAEKLVKKTGDFVKSLF